LPENNKLIIWQSSDNRVAFVDAHGVVTGISNGNAVITAYTGNGLSATCDVRVGKKNVIIESKQTVVTQYYSFGKYVGECKNGIPDGVGTMYYNKSVRIAKYATEKYCAETGDTLVGLWGNGDIISGELRDKNNNHKATILSGKRPTPYNIENDGPCI